MTVEFQRRGFTVEEYHEMARAGILDEDDRVELIEGQIIEMSPIGSRHAGGVKRLNHLFSERIAGRAIVSVQDPAHVDDYSEPQPDVVLLRPRADFYADAHPRPSDVLLLVEVADSSLRFDRDVKLPLYARASIPEVWLLDVLQEQLLVCRDPRAGRYEQQKTLRPGDHVRPLAFPDVDLPVAQILGVG